MREHLIDGVLFRGGTERTLTLATGDVACSGIYETRTVDS